MSWTAQPDDPTPWEPPLAGSEAEHLIGALDRLRWTFRWKAAGLDADSLGRCLPGDAPELISSLTIGGLLKHLALVEDVKSTDALAGTSPGPPWETIDFDEDPEWEFRTGATDPPAALYALYDAAVARSRDRFAAAIKRGGLDQLVHLNDGEGHHASLRRLLFDLVEEYGRHTGHADLLRESIDGLVGEDPPASWRPHAG